MDWNKAVLVGANVVVVVVLGLCVLLGHNSAVTDGLIAAAALVVGGSAYTAVFGKKKTE